MFFDYRNQVTYHSDSWKGNCDGDWDTASCGSGSSPKSSGSRSRGGWDNGNVAGGGRCSSEGGSRINRWCNNALLSADAGSGGFTSSRCGQSSIDCSGLSVLDGCSNNSGGGSGAKSICQDNTFRSTIGASSLGTRAGDTGSKRDCWSST